MYPETKYFLCGCVSPVVSTALAVHGGYVGVFAAGMVLMAGIFSVFKAFKIVREIQ